MFKVNSKPPADTYRDFSGFSSLSRICDSSPTSSSSTLWLIPTEVSINLQSYWVAICLPSAKLRKKIGQNFPPQKNKANFSPSEVTIRLRARSALLATRMTAFWAMFSDVHSTCRISSAIWKLDRSEDEQMTQQPCGSYEDMQFSG